ncbi:hypothetical protein A3D78_03205 [Candidatus Gottesmanbacteria bacterium RIFCSPHIGHO2_02_FULL_39_14]|uniref:Fibronectin type-III domain-containing protein n=2 Tax=Candidatus Gottesmaniibacteriota TaxID=1752720 RepID=A0A1F5ZY50_9BACT|nr:MAG: hypothetical protein A3D78_03205 [Candidatus Gottesmanbacteria bacterium RIFCSPHIGHO2_02_FULL_39_14]OGG30827.1 MAG: hypothetical protein A3I51_03430 [Candidatus Gottesmanbacteria bacterium RIFCSPLOWO2_02_FULL_38_8]
MKILGKLTLSILAVLTLFSLTALKPVLVAANDCGGPYPPKPDKVWTKSGPGGSEVTIYWNEVAYANRYAVAYGLESGKYLYGATNIGGTSSRSYTVKGLTPGTKYYLVLSAARDCSASPFSNEVTAWAGSGTVAYAKASASQAATTVSQGAASAKAMAVEAANLSVWSGPGVGQVTLKWYHREDVDNYHLVYGTKMGQYEYGALNIGKVTQFTVGSLVPGRAYYFALVPVKGDRALYTGQGVRGVAKGVPAREVVMTNPSNLEPVPVTRVEEPVSVNIDEGSPVIPPDQEQVQGIEDTVPENIGGLPDISNEGYAGNDEEGFEEETLPNVENEGYVGSDD